MFGIYFVCYLSCFLALLRSSNAYSFYNRNRLIVTGLSLAILSPSILIYVVQFCMSRISIWSIKIFKSPFYLYIWHTQQYFILQVFMSVAFHAPGFVDSLTLSSYKVNTFLLFFFSFIVKNKKGESENKWINQCVYTITMARIKSLATFGISIDCASI